jgi:hypothetical protein
MKFPQYFPPVVGVSLAEMGAFGSGAKPLAIPFPGQSSIRTVTFAVQLCLHGRRVFSKRTSISSGLRKSTRRKGGLCGALSDPTWRWLSVYPQLSSEASRSLASRVFNASGGPASEITGAGRKPR